MVVTPVLLLDKLLSMLPGLYLVKVVMGKLLLQRLQDLLSQLLDQKDSSYLLPAQMLPLLRERK